MGAGGSSGWARRGGRRHLGEFAFPTAEWITIQGRLACGARSEFLTPIGGFGNRRRVAGSQSEVAAGSRIGRLPVAFAAGRPAKRVLRAVEPDAGYASDRDRRTGRASGSLPR